MKSFKEFFIISMIVISVVIFSSCGSVFDEGDLQASQSFDLMTVQERSFYDAVEEEWGQGRLTSIRNAVFNRDMKPNEKSIPFGDIGNVIITNNNVTLKLTESWGTSTKNRYIKARWNQLDPKWFRDLLNVNGIANFKPQELIPEEEEVIKEYVEFEKAKIPNIGYTEVYEESKPVIDTNELVMFDDYDLLYYEIKKCPEAIELYNTIIEERILNKDDIDQIMISALGCKARSIKDKLNK